MRLRVEKDCARCGRSVTIARRQGAWCPTCGVFLCGACIPHGRCPLHDVKVRQTDLTFPAFLLAMAVVWWCFSGAMYVWSQEDAARAQIPVTPIADLQPGTTAKVNGTIGAHQLLVLWRVSVGDSSEWEAIPFNVTDGTGTVDVHVDLVWHVNDVIQAGRHDAGWWRGDAVAVIGDVQRDADGSLVVIARYIARTPTSFYRPWETLVPFLIVPAMFTVPGAYGVAVYRHRSALHRERAPLFPAKVYGGTPCPSCGILLGSRVTECRSCGWTEPKPRPALGEEDRAALAALPTLTLRTAVANLSRRAKLGIVFVVAGVPAILFAASYWFVQATAPFMEPLLCGLPILVVFVALAVLMWLSISSTTTLAADRIELRYRIGKTGLPTAEVGKIAMLRRRDDILFTVATHDGKSTAQFGSGLTPVERDRAQRWLEDLARIVHADMEEVHSSPEMYAFLANRRPRTGT